FRPARVGIDRAGRRPRHVFVPTRVLHGEPRGAGEGRRRQGGADHLEAAQRPHGHRRPLLPQGVHALRVVQRAACGCVARMAKVRTLFFCTECGNETPRWQGQCPACNAWNTLVEEPAPEKRRGGRAGTTSLRVASAMPAVRLADVDTVDSARWPSGIAEFDFVLGGGTVPGSLVLVGGEPGIGKSTLLLQVAARLQSAGHAALYGSGEESAAQTRLRSERLPERAGDVLFLAETRLESILERAAEHGPAV